MKTATKKIALYILSFVFAICLGAFAFVSMGNTKTVNADDPTVINVTCSKIGINDHNDKAGVYGDYRVTAIRFSDDQASSNTGVFSGSADGVYDWSNLIANTTYTGSSNTFVYAPANVTWTSGYKSSTFNFIYLCTANQPATDDTVKINAGAYFIMTGTQVYPTSGTCNDKYVITADITIRYNGTAWEYVAPVPDPVAFVLGNDLWAGADQSGKNGAQLTAWGIDNDGNAAAYPTTGTFALLNAPSSPLAIGPSDNHASSITGIKYNGTPINEIYGAVVAEWLTYLAIYVPYRTGIIHFEKNTVIGSGYLADDYYYSLSVIGGHGRATLCYLVEFDSNGGSEVESVYVNSGALVTRPEIQFRTIGDKEFYIEYWYLNDENVAYDFATPVTSNMSLTAKWSETTYYTVTFDSEGGTAVAPSEVLKGLTVSTPTPPTKEQSGDKGYVFEYWYLSDENTAYDFATPVTENITLTAKWAVRQTVNVTFTKLNSTWNNYAYEQGGYTKYSLIEFTGGISSGHHGQGMDMSNITENTTYTGSSNTWNFLSSSLIYGPNIADNNKIIFRTVNNPEVGDQVKINAGAWFIVGGEDNSKYVLTDDILLTFNGTHWVVGEYVPPVETEVTFSGLGSYDNTQLNATSSYFTQLVFTTMITSGGSAGMDYSNLKANTTYKDKNGNNTDVTWDYISGVYLLGEDKEVNFILFYTLNNTLPSKGDTVTISKDAWFMVGGADNNKYILTDDIVLSFNGWAWIIGENAEPTEVEVTFSNINTYNNTKNIHTDTYFTKLAFNVGVSTGANSRSGYWENLVYTYSGSATVSFRNAGYGYTSVANGKSNDVYNYIMMETDVCPQNGDTLTISKGSWFATGGTINDKYIITDDITLTFLGEWIFDYDNMQEVEFVGVNNYGWNNTRVFSYSEVNTVRTLLIFDKNLGTVSNGNNHSAACNYITVNGVPLSEIAGATVDYSQGLNYILILMPESALIPTNLYPITKLEIAAETPFENSRLPAVTLSLLGGAWVEGEFSSYDDLSDDGYTTIKDIAGTSRVDINSSTVYENVLNSGNVDFRFVLTASDLNGFLQLCLKKSTEYWGGFRFLFYSDGIKYIVEVYDASTGGNGTEHLLLGTFPIGLAANDYAAFAIRINESNGVYSIVIVEDGVKIGEITDIELAGDKIGNDIRLEPTLITCTFIDYKKGDVSAPYICVDTPLVYFLTEGDDVPEIAYRLFDRTDASVSCEKIWDDGAYSEDKMNVGTYYCTIRATDGHGNVSEKKITVNVSPKEKEREEIKFTVRFNNKNATEYVLGSLIEQPADPTKESTKQKTYEFDGWYNGEEKWDFINDTVSSDVNLTAKYIEKDRLYTVTVIVGEDSYKMHVKYGAQPDLSMFDKSDYVAVYTVDGKEVDMISVTSDMTVNIAYVKNKSGCGSNVNPSYIAIPALMAAAITLILRKKEKNDEE